jgi:transcriptional regulator with GAF, ATPase, and Fis domain
MWGEILQAWDRQQRLSPPTAAADREACESSATGPKAHTMPIDPAMLAKSIATLTDLDPERDLAATLDQAVVAAKQLFGVDAAGIMLADADGKLRWASASDPLAQTLEDNQETFAAGPCLQAFASGRPAVICDATLEPHWGEITLAFVELQIRSGLSVPVQLGGGPIGTLDVYAAAPRGWDATEVSALQTYAGLVATLLGTAAKAERSGRLSNYLEFRPRNPSWDLKRKRPQGHLQKSRRVTSQLLKNDRFCHKPRSPATDRPAASRTRVRNQRRTTAGVTGLCNDEGRRPCSTIRREVQP